LGKTARPNLKMQVVTDSVRKALGVINRLPHRRFFDSSVYIYFYIAAFSFYVVGMLMLTDHFLAANISGYEFSGNYAIGMGIFFCVAVMYLHLARWRRWLNWRYYILGAVVVFFPLVFLASSVKLMFDIDGTTIYTLNLQYCDAENTESICGPAFAALVSSMSLRALPVVLTTPAMFWYLFIRAELCERSSPTSTPNRSPWVRSFSDRSPSGRTSSPRK